MLDPIRIRWVNPNKFRYYEAHLVLDLFAEWNLIRVWGGLGSRLGGMRSGAVASYADGIREIQRIGRRRSRHGYTETPSNEPRKAKTPPA